MQGGLLAIHIPGRLKRAKHLHALSLSFQKDLIFCEFSFCENHIKMHCVSEMENVNYFM